MVLHQINTCPHATVFALKAWKTAIQVITSIIDEHTIKII